MARPACKYGDKCYRRQKAHFVELSHPFVEGIAARINEGDVEGVISLDLDPVVLEQAQLVAELLANGEIDVKSEPADPSTGAKRTNSEVDDDSLSSPSTTSEPPMSKKVRLSPPSPVPKALNEAVRVPNTLAGKILAASPFHYFLSTVTGVPETKGQPLSISFSDLFDPSLGALKESVQFNFMVELGWLLAQYCQHKVQRKPLLVVYGMESEEMRTAHTLVPTMKTVRVKPKYPFGSHHSKMALLSYEDGSLRVVIHTGNLIESDWEDRTQGLWISPSCPPSTNQDDGEDSPTGFKKDLFRYLEGYSMPDVFQSWMDKIRRCDMSAINVFLIPSVPGSHPVSGASRWGHDHLARLLRQHAMPSEGQGSSSIVMQCSSIGSLGPQPSSWLEGELAQSMMMMSGHSSGRTEVKVIYPSYQDVKSSLHGLAGGGCLPYSRATHAKQPWFTSFLHRWRSDERLRTKAVPHIKSYARISSANPAQASWFLLTSANLSKAAWGMRTNKGANLMIQSFEVGVLFLPKFLKPDSSSSTSSFDLKGELSLPYDWPLTPYGPNDHPWFIDQLVLSD